MGLVRRWLYFGAWLFKSLFLNLTPARRVLLALALFLLWVRAQWGAGGHALRVDFGGLAIGLLLLLLMLELKDKLVARSELQAGRVIQQALLPNPTCERGGRRSGRLRDPRGRARGGSCWPTCAARDCRRPS